MSGPHAFVFVQHDQQSVVGRAILQTNIARRQQFHYRSIILTEPRLGWIGLLLGEGGGLTDHLLARNLSGYLNTRTFELSQGMYEFAYRVHDSGKTVGAYESNLPYFVNKRLRMIESAGDVRILDLGEPLERFILKRYHDLQHPTSAITLSLKIPDEVQVHYEGNAAQLRPLLSGESDERYVSTLLKPGYNHEKAFESLIGVLNLPYLPTDKVYVSDTHGATHTVTGYDQTTPSFWEAKPLPHGWRRMPALPPQMQ